MEKEKERAKQLEFEYKIKEDEMKKKEEYLRNRDTYLKKQNKTMNANPNSKKQFKSNIKSGKTNPAPKAKKTSNYDRTEWANLKKDNYFDAYY